MIIPEALQPLIYAAGLIALAIMAVFAARKIRDNLTGDSIVIMVIRDMLYTVIDEVYKKIEALDLPIEEQEGRVRELAVQVYTELPSQVIINVSGRNLVIPVKTIVTEEMFVEACWFAYTKSGDLVAELQKMLKENYEDWRATGGTLPYSKYSIPVYRV